MSTKRKHPILRYKWSYLFILPGALALFVFAYVPMFGVMIAFQNFSVVTGFFGSPWVGFENFRFFQDEFFWNTVSNTLRLTIYRMAFAFPMPIIFAILLNEVRSSIMRRSIQSLIYLPHFVSWIVVAYILNSALALDVGVVNSLLQRFGFEQIHFMGDPRYFRTLIVFSSIWKGTGWGTIIYLAALSNIDPQLHDAAKIDGAGRFARIWHIDLTGILPIIIIILILSMPGLLHAGYEQIYPLVNPANMSVSNVLDVYLIRIGLSGARYSMAAALGLALSVVNLGLVLGTNYLSRKLGQEGLW